MAGPADALAYLKTGGLSGTFVTNSGQSRLADELYATLEPYSEVDAAHGYALRTICEALAKMYEDVDELVRESLAGDPGWSALLDATRIPDEGLAWLGQIFGVVLTPGASVAQSRESVTAAAGISRGTPATMIAAAQRLLTGNKTVLLTERTSDGWHFAVRTRVTETPNSAAVLAALVAAKPAGLIMDYATFAGVLFQEQKAAYATYTLSKAAKATYTLRGT